MTRRLRRAVHVGGLALVVCAIGLWLATGREGFTRWPDERLERADRPPATDEADLLAEIGFGEAAPADAGSLKSRFAFGLAPSGADPLHLASVATACGLAVLASTSVVALSIAERRRRARHVVSLDQERPR